MRHSSLSFYSFLPFLTALILLIIDNATTSFLSYRHSFFSLIFPFIFYFRLFSSDFLRIPALLVLGIFADELMQAPLGFNGVLFLLFYALTYKNRHNLLKLTFKKLWLAYSALLLVVLACGMGMVYAIYGIYPDIISESVILILSYPLFFKLALYIDYVIGVHR